MIPTLRIALLGDFLLSYGDAPITTADLPRLQSLLAYLVLHRAAPQSRSQLAFLLWPDSTDAQAHTNLRGLVHRLRRLLPDVERFLRTERQTLHWSPERAWSLDVANFEDALAQAHLAEQARDQVAACLALKRAVEIYHGDLLPSCYDEWILGERERLRQMFLDALERLMLLLERQRDYLGAISMAQSLLRHDPLHETTYRHLMRLYASNGDRGAALRIYHTCATVLERELTVEPSLATREVYERLMHVSYESTDTLKSPSALLVGVAPLVGRESEWVQMQEAWHVATAGQQHMVVLSGEAGIGKTRLAEELLTWAARQGILTASTRCYAAEGGSAYAPVGAWLRTDMLRAGLSALSDVWLSEIVRLVPDLLIERPNIPRPGPLRESWQRQRLFEALARAILEGHQPLLLLLDDLQWCDQETLEWLHYLLHFDPQARLLLVGTVRPEEMEVSHPLASLLMALRRSGQLTEILLGPLSVTETAALAEHVAGRSLHSSVLTSLYSETEGNPLFVVETMRMDVTEVAERVFHPVVSATTLTRQVSRLSPTVQAVIEARLEQLTSPTRQLAGLAATIGRAFSFAVLAQASGSSEDNLVQGLDELWQRRIIREQGTDSYDFSHEKLREVAYASLSTARRRLLHRRVAEALEVVYAGTLESVSGQIASHYEQANVALQAIPYYRRAAEVASQVSAYADALVYFRRALALLETAPSGAARLEATAQLQEQMGDVLAVTGQHNEARISYQQALSLTGADDRIWQARLHRKIGDSLEPEHRCEEALQAYDLAEASLGVEQAEATPSWWQQWIHIYAGRIAVYYHLAQWQNMAEAIEKVRPIVELCGTPMQRAALFYSLYLMNLRRDRYTVSDETLAYAQAALARSRESEQQNPGEIARYQFNVGLCYLWRGNLSEAEERMQTALVVAERLGYVMLQSMCLNYLTIVYRKRGQVEVVREYIPRCRAAAMAGQRPQYLAMAESNQAWVAWHDGNLDEAQEHGLAALELWHQPPVDSMGYPFDWTALWPLIGVALAQDRISDAIDYARALLVPNQQPLPDELSAVVEAAVQAWDVDRLGATCRLLQQALAGAEQMH